MFPNRRELIRRCLRIVNYADGFYHFFGVRIILSHLEIWDTDPIRVVSDPEEVSYY